MNLRMSFIGVVLVIAGLTNPIQASVTEEVAVASPRAMTIERLYSLPSIIGTAPESPTWSPDSRQLAFLWNDEGMPFRDIWLTDSRGGKPVRVTRMPQLEYPSDPGTDTAKLEQAARFETDHGISELVWAPDGRHLVFALHGTLYQVLPGKVAEQLSKDGVSGGDLATLAQAKAIAFRSAGGLWIAAFKAGKLTTRTIHSPGRKDVRVESFAWSGDGKRLAFIEADLSKVPTRGIPDYLGEETRMVEVKRPFPGEPSPARRLGVIAASGGEVTWMDLGDDPLDPIFDVRWSPDNRHLLVDKSDLYIKQRQLLILEPGNGESRLLLQESDPNNVTAEWWADWAPDGKGIYFISDRDNDYHVYYQALAGGEPTAITAGNWAVFSASISTTADALFVVSNERNTESRRLHRIALSGGEAQLVTASEGAHHASVSPDGQLIADLYSNDITPPDLYLQSTAPAQGKRRQLTHSPLPEFKSYRWIAPRYVVFHALNDNTPVQARLTLPPEFDPNKTHPAILGSVYSNSVHNEWGGRVYHPTWGLDQILAQQGYVIMNVDFGGSSGHGKAFRQRIREDYGGVDVDDLYSATRYLINEFQVDPKRIGIWGSSYGGLLTTMSMFRYPDAYAAGVAGAPATNVFHAMTGEMQTMMAPQDHAAQYEKSSAYLRSGDLKGHLMLIHGMRDWIVLYKDTLTLVERLILQGKSVDLVTLPNAGHGWDTEGLAQTRFAFRKLIDHFKRYLGAAE